METKCRADRAAVVLAASFLFFGCAPDAVFEAVVSLDVVPPIYVEARMPAADRLSLGFSEAVRIVSLRFSPDLPVAGLSDGGEVALVSFAGPVVAGLRYVVDCVAEDAEGNSVSVLAPFYGRNDDPPRLLINEVRTEYSKPKVEFVELLVLESGELGGLSIATSAAGFGEPVFVFPPCRVSAGEFVVLHLRSIEEGLVDETGSLDASSGTEASPAARDFWVPGAEKRVRKTDMVALLDTQGEALDAVAFSETPGSEWKTDDLKACAAFLERSRAWIGEPVASAASTTTRTIGRKQSAEDGGGKADWAIAATGGASPGAANSEKYYVAAVKSSAAAKPSAGAP